MKHDEAASDGEVFHGVLKKTFTGLIWAVKKAALRGGTVDAQTTWTSWLGNHTNSSGTMYDTDPVLPPDRTSC